MPTVQGIRLIPEAAQPVRRTFTALFVMLFLSPIFYLVWGIWISGVGFYFIGGSFIFILVTIGDIKKKIALNDRGGVSCCSGLFLVLALACLVLAASFMLQLGGMCALACAFGFWDGHSDVSADRVVFPLFVVLAVVTCEFVIFFGLRDILKIGIWREGPHAALAEAARTASGRQRVHDLPGSQWVSRSPGASAEYSTLWSRHQVVGRPKVYPRFGHLAGAWAPRGRGPDEWIELEFDEPVRVGAIEIYETFTPGTVVAVKLRHGPAATGEWVVAWQGEAQRELPPAARIFSPQLEQLPFSTRHVRLELDLRSAVAWPEIDAVRVLRQDMPTVAIATAMPVENDEIMLAVGEVGEGDSAEQGVPVFEGVVVGALPPGETSAEPVSAEAAAAIATGVVVNGAAAGGDDAPVGAAVGQGLSQHSSSRPPRGVPPLVVLTGMFREELGVSGLSMSEVVANACMALSVDTTGLSVTQQATACWRALGSPPCA